MRYTCILFLCLLEEYTGLLIASWVLSLAHAQQDICSAYDPEGQRTYLASNSASAFATCDELHECWECAWHLLDWPPQGGQGLHQQPAQSRNYAIRTVESHNLHASDATRRRLAYMGMRIPNWLRARVLERSLLAQLLHPTTHGLHMQHDWTRGETAGDHWPCGCCWQQQDPARFPSHVSPPHNVPLASSPSSGISSTSSSPAKKFHGNTPLVTP